MTHRLLDADCRDTIISYHETGRCTVIAVSGAIDKRYRPPQNADYIIYY